MNKKSIAKALMACICVAFMLVQGCKVGQKYERPDLDIPDQFRGIRWRILEIHRVSVAYRGKSFFMIQR